MATYLETYPLSISNGQGLISALSDIAEIPWNTLTDEQKQDIERLYGVRSGFKTLVNSFLSADTSARARLLSALYSQKWTRLWEDYVLEYNPLDAYTLTETGSREIEKSGSDVTKYGKTHNESGTDGGSVTRTGEDTMQHGRVVAETGTDTGTVETAGTDNNNATDSVYGFNSSLPVPSGTGTEQNTSNATETRDLATSHNVTNSGTDTRNTSDTENRNLTNSKNITNAGQDEKTLSEDETENYSYTKKGNIGYTTPQELIRQNIELWKVPFFGIVFADIDEFMTVSVY